ncbi:hypothetical protein D9M71_609360 [compost metagenome]
MNGTNGSMLSNVAISAPVPSAFARTLMRTFSHLSPSMMSSPPRPSMRSLPLPPRMMLPPSKNVAPAASKSDRPLIRLMLVSTLPVAPAVGSDVASVLSPRRKSPWDEPDRPSMMSKRTSAEAPEPGIGGTSKKRSVKSMLTPWASPLKVAQS